MLDSVIEVDLDILQKHIDQYKKESGSMASYCREHNLNYDKFVYHRDRQLKQRKVVSATKPLGFAQVQAISPAQPLQVTAAQASRLPDPKWLAEFIYSFMSHK